MLLYDLIRRGAETHPERAALYFHGDSISYGDLDARVNALARGLAQRGIGPSDRVAVLLPNCPEFVITYYAAAAVGAVCVPANPQLKPPELAYIWGDAGAKLVVTAPC